MRVYFSTWLPLVKFLVVLLFISPFPLTAQTSSGVIFYNLEGESNKNNEVEIRWGAKNHGEVVEYVVMRSIDQVIFENIGSVKGSEIENYRFLDINAPTGMVHYLVKAIDSKEKISVSKVLCVNNVLSTNHTPNVDVYPNPVVSNLNIKIGPHEDVTRVTIKNSRGTILVSRPTVTGQGGAISLRLNMAALPNGVYFVVFEMGASSTLRSYTECVIKQ